MGFKLGQQIIDIIRQKKHKYYILDSILDQIKKIKSNDIIVYRNSFSWKNQWDSYFKQNSSILNIKLQQLKKIWIPYQLTI